MRDGAVSRRGVDQFQAIDLDVAIETVQWMMREDNRSDEENERNPRWSEEQVLYCGRILWLLTQRGAISLVHTPEFRKARALKDAIKAFLEDPPGDYQERSKP